MYSYSCLTVSPFIYNWQSQTAVLNCEWEIVNCEGTAVSALNLLGWERPFPTSIVKIGKRGVARTGIRPQRRAEDRAPSRRRVAGDVLYRLSGQLANGQHINRIVGHKTGVDVTKWGRRGPVGNSQYNTHRYGSGYTVKNAGGVGSMKVSKSRWEWARGNRGALGSVLGAGLLDGAFQIFGDTIVKNLCLSPHQVFWRGMVALGFGLVGGAVGLLAGGIAVGIFGITATIATFSVAGIIAWGSSLTFAIVTSGAKNDALGWITKEMDWQD